MSSPSSAKSSPEPSVELARALAWAFDLTGTAPPTKVAARRLLVTLAAYPEDAVLRALRRCAEEVKGRLCLADIIERITADDGRPTADEAWAQVGAASEADTIITTNEALLAMEEVRALRDETGARMGFRAAYLRIVRERRAAGTPAQAHVSLGTDPARRQAVLARAVQAGRLDAEHAEALSGIPAAVLLGKALPARSAKVAELVGAVLAPGGPPRCGMTDCNGFTHGESGAICPAWGPL